MYHRSCLICPPRNTAVVVSVVTVETLDSYVLLRGTILNRTYGRHKTLYISLFFTKNIWSYYLGSPVILYSHRKIPLLVGFSISLRGTIVNRTKVCVVKIGEDIGFCVCRRSYLPWSPVNNCVPSRWCARLYSSTIYVVLLLYVSYPRDVMRTAYMQRVQSQRRRTCTYSVYVQGYSDARVLSLPLSLLAPCTHFMLGPRSGPIPFGTLLPLFGGAEIYKPPAAGAAGGPPGTT